MLLASHVFGRASSVATAQRSVRVARVVDTPPDGAVVSVPAPLADAGAVHALAVSGAEWAALAYPAAGTLPAGVAGAP